MEEDAKRDEKPDLSEYEENPPSDLAEWPSDERKYETLGGGEGDHGYEEGPEKNLGPSGLRHHEDGTVTIDGEEVDDPEEYKGEPIPGGPTDPNAPKTLTEQRRETDSDSDSDSGSDDSDD